ncbi:MAG: Smr/MutS family protein [Bacilli bacterium]|nr:Smr/MutS family protein [Bacilli bacterium]
MISWSYYPSIDLHGEFAVTAYTVVHDFITDQIKLKNKYVLIIHGKGSGKLKEEVHHILSQDKRVVQYQLDGSNLGQTIVELRV